MADSLLLRGVNTILDHEGTEMVYMSNPRGGDTYAFPQWWNVNAAGAPNVQCTKFEVTNANGTCILLVDVSKSEGITLKIVHDGSFGFTFPERLGTRRAALFTDAYELIEAYEFQADPYAPVLTTAGTGSKPTAKTIGTVTRASGDLTASDGDTVSYTGAISGNATSVTYSIASSESADTVSGMDVTFNGTGTRDLTITATDSAASDSPKDSAAFTVTVS